MKPTYWFTMDEFFKFCPTIMRHFFSFGIKFKYIKCSHVKTILVFTEFQIQNEFYFVYWIIFHLHHVTDYYEHLIFYCKPGYLIIKISTHLCYIINVDWFSWGWSKKKFEKKSKWLTLLPQFTKFFRENFRDWCKGHQRGSTLA